MGRRGFRVERGTGKLSQHKKNVVKKKKKKERDRSFKEISEGKPSHKPLLTNHQGKDGTGWDRGLTIAQTNIQTHSHAFARKKPPKQKLSLKSIVRT